LKNTLLSKLDDIFFAFPPQKVPQNTIPRLLTFTDPPRHPFLISFPGTCTSSVSLRQSPLRIGGTLTVAEAEGGGTTLHKSEFLTCAHDGRKRTRGKVTGAGKLMSRSGGSVADYLFIRACSVARALMSLHAMVVNLSGKLRPLPNSAATAVGCRWAGSQFPWCGPLPGHCHQPL
jgi:hypothetical protein